MSVAGTSPQRPPSFRDAAAAPPTLPRPPPPASCDAPTAARTRRVAPPPAPPPPPLLRRRGARPQHILKRRVQRLKPHHQTTSARSIGAPRRPCPSGAAPWNHCMYSSVVREQRRDVRLALPHRRLYHAAPLLPPQCGVGGSRSHRRAPLPPCRASADVIVSHDRSALLPHPLSWLTRRSGARRDGRLTANGHPSRGEQRTAATRGRRERLPFGVRRRPPSCCAVSFSLVEVPAPAQAGHPCPPNEGVWPCAAAVGLMTAARPPRGGNQPSPGVV